MAGEDTPTKTFTEAEFEAALQREKARLAEEAAKAAAKYASDDEKLNQFNQELAELKKYQRQAEKEKADREKALEAERRKAEEAELNAQQLVEKRSAEAQAQIDELKKQREHDLALFAKEREYQQLQMYIQQAVARHAEDIEPRLLDYIGGATPEEVDASVQRAIQKTLEMHADIEAAQNNARAGMRGVGTGPTAITEMDRPASEGTVTGQDVTNMSWEDYAKFRQGRIPNMGQGLFG